MRINITAINRNDDLILVAPPRVKSATGIMAPPASPEKYPRNKKYEQENKQEPQGKGRKEYCSAY